MEDNVRDKLLTRLNNALDVKDVSVPVKTKQQEKIDSDYDFANKTLKNLIEVGEEAIETAKDVAIESSEPRSFEVLAVLIKNVGDLAKGIMDTAKTKTEIDKATAVNVKPEASNMTQNNIFVGTTADLLKLTDKDVINNE